VGGGYIGLTRAPVKRSTGHTHTHTTAEHTTAEQTTHTNTEQATAQRRLIVKVVVASAPVNRVSSHSRSCESKRGVNGRVYDERVDERSCKPKRGVHARVPFVYKPSVNGRIRAWKGGVNDLLRQLKGGVNERVCE